MYFSDMLVVMGKKSEDFIFIILIIGLYLFQKGETVKKMREEVGLFSQASHKMVSVQKMTKV